jgi:hypothetical protein
MDDAASDLTSTKGSSSKWPREPKGRRILISFQGRKAVRCCLGPQCRFNLDGENNQRLIEQLGDRALRSENATENTIHAAKPFDQNQGSNHSGRKIKMRRPWRRPWIPNDRRVSPMESIAIFSVISDVTCNASDDAQNDRRAFRSSVFLVPNYILARHSS